MDVKSIELRTARRVFGITLIIVTAIPAPALARSWQTDWASDEYPPQTCAEGVVGGMWCQGSKCDDIRLNCTDDVKSHTKRRWLPFVSEEQLAGAMCSAGEGVTGISCRGNNCDDISIECAEIDSIPNDCDWLPPFSEEQGTHSALPAGSVVRGIKCSGSNCDNISLHACHP